MPHSPIPYPQWSLREAAHAERADAATAGWRARRLTGEKHEIDDFLFTYYKTRPGPLRRWHPGAGISLHDDAASPGQISDRLAWRWHTRAPDGGVTVDVEAFLAERGGTVTYIRDLVAATARRPANVGCFGLHEWAMVYKQGDDTRHTLPLRLGASGTDEVVEAHQIRCSHFDAFRFFTPEAVPLNRLQPTRDDQPALEQPGCLHAGMDLFKWTNKLVPLLPSELVLDCFELARDIRGLDMQASPYDVSRFGEDAVMIETPEGKVEYARRQRDFADRAAPLRERIVALCDRALADGTPGGTA
ncbi:hypothetical protein SAMN05216410_3613 [Sanguibacter gelidistatuariae]|uniref:3-methyladenine DNA glycosylase n=1 Tax=Sanguibacter gelidistatuariae TaxID=1814289 RepID=A0A1G6WFN4_9MICO|nr:3-methyladenine DNA glycosylase [Sanguibacter gelidistatuariae]SDD63876.1 hypothetical protein SAMN05216410_3613 [Sanguibacter gelidistatuariae]